MDKLQYIKTFKDFQDGNVRGVMEGGGSYDRYFVWVGDELVADIATKDQKTVWTRSITPPGRLKSAEAKALAKELQTPADREFRRTQAEKAALQTLNRVMGKYF